MIIHDRKCSRLNYHFALLNRDNMHLASQFDCGNKAINRVLKDYAYKADDMVTYLFIDSDNDHLIGFASLSCSAICIEEGVFHQALPAIEVRYFALANEYQKIRVIDLDDNEDDPYYISDEIFSQVIAIIREISQQSVGAQYMILYSVPDARSFYDKFHMKPFEEFVFEHVWEQNKAYLDGCKPLFLPLF